MCYNPGMDRVLEEVVRRCDAGQAVALCTVVAARGSTPQAAGARMLLSPESRLGHWILLGQNFHLGHHLWPSVPFYNYRRLSDRLRPQFESAGVRLEGFLPSHGPDRLAAAVRTAP